MRPPGLSKLAWSWALAALLLASIAAEEDAEYEQPGWQKGGGGYVSLAEAVILSCASPFYTLS